MATTVLTFYGDLMSQSCRAVAIFMKLNNIAYSEKRAMQRKGAVIEERSRINLLHAVPAIDDDGFILTEGMWEELDRPMDLQLCLVMFSIMSIHAGSTFGRYVEGAIERDAILKYLCSRYSVAEHWYPSELQLRARVDEFCTWSNMNIHACAYGVYHQQILEPRIKNIPIDMERLRRSQLELERGLDQMEQVFLKDSAYVCGPEITIADLLVACELMQAVCAGHSVQASHPKLADWLIRIDKRLRPHFHDVHVMVTELKGLRGSVYQCGSFDT